MLRKRGAKQLETDNDDADKGESKENAMVGKRERTAAKTNEVKDERSAKRRDGAQRGENT